MKVVAKNKKARYNYDFLDTLVAGISLLGSEVKSIKLGNVNIEGSFVKINKGVVQIYGMHVSKYEFQNIGVHDEFRIKNLLLTKREIRNLNDKIILERLSIIPTKILINKNGFIKVELSIGKGRNKKDKREYEKEKEFKKIKKEYL